MKFETQLIKLVLINMEKKKIGYNVLANIKIRFPNYFNI